ncbi:MAG TPA: energy transducer TonB [Bryobacteraceae bacterium]|nr:energy transducer TonB [Bryobacteraceae bacterium]
MFRPALLILAAALVMHADSPGITVDSGGPLLHRSAVDYPREALRHNIEGTVVVEVSLDGNGEVAGVEIVSGPPELRRAVLESVPEWHYSPGMTLPAKVQATVIFKLTGQLSPPPEPDFQMPAEPLGTLQRLQINGLDQPAGAALAARLPIHEGDPLTPELVEKARQIVSNFDAHLRFSVMAMPAGSVVLIRIPPQNNSVATASDSPPPPNGVQRIRVGSNVQAAKLVSSTQPEMPPLAKQARISGVVRLNVIIGLDGHVGKITVVSGHPLLVPPAIEAVKTWVYQTTLLNGKPVEVATQVDVHMPAETSGAAR